MGGPKGSQTKQDTNNSQTYSANPVIQGAANQAITGAQSAASQPFQMPVAPIAGFGADQNQAFQQYRNLQGTAQPYFQQAANYTNQSATPITGADVNQYYNPMAANVTANLKDIFGAQNTQNTGNLVQSAGGVGADRIAVGQADMAKQQGLAAGQTYAGLYQQALQAAQQQKQMAAGAGSAFANYGTGAQNAQLQGTGALNQAGLQQQQQNQAELNAPYQNQLARIAYQFQTPQYLAGITGGLAPALGGTTVGNQNSVTTPPTPSFLNQALGVGTAAAGMYGAFGGFGGNNDPSYGNGNGVYGGNSASPLAGLNASDYGPGYAEGGQVEDQPLPFPGASIPKVGGAEPIPMISLPMGGGHSGPLTGGINFPSPSQPQQSNSGSGGIGQELGQVASIASMFLKRGGVAGYDDGGDVVDPSRPIEGRVAPIGAPWPFNTAHTEMGGNGTMVPNEPAINIGKSDQNYSWGQLGRDLGIMGSPAAPPQVATPDTATSPSGTPLPSADPRKAFPAPRSPKIVAGAPATAGPAVAKAVATAPEALETTERNPYPDALQRDWGQNATRSPWMALVKAGATMAATPGPLGTAIGKGILAGTGSLETQRKELRSEQELNDKAQALYQSAQVHLDKYNKMTPYEKATVALKNRELDQSEAGTGGKPDLTPANIAKYISIISNDPASITMTPEQKQAKAIAMIRAQRGTVDIGPGTSSGTAVSDPGEGKREAGKWYIGPSGKPQQWIGQ